MVISNVQLYMVFANLECHLISLSDQMHSESACRIVSGLEFHSPVQVSELRELYLVLEISLILDVVPIVLHGVLKPRGAADHVLSEVICWNNDAHLVKVRWAVVCTLNNSQLPTRNLQSCSSKG